jgi:hypothetical protein
MRRIFGYMLALSLLAVTPSALAQGSSAQKAAQIRQLIEITGSKKIALQFADAVTKDLEIALRKLRPDIPARAIELMRQEMIDLFSQKMDVPGGLTDSMIVIYDKHYSAAEIQDVLNFYSTPTGRKLIATMPDVLAESMAAGQKWGQGLGAEAAARTRAVLQREGIELPRK